MRVFVVIFIISFLAVPSFAAKYAGDPFSLGAGARQLAMGRASVAGPFDGTAAYWNPAGLNLLTGRQISAMHSETFGSLLNHDYLSYTVDKSSSGSKFKAFGFYLYYLGGGGIKITRPDEVTNRYIVIREESHADIMLAGSLSGKIKDKIDVGLTVKIIYRDVVDVNGYGLSADIGALYQPYDFARVGLVITDFTSGIIRYSNGNTESIVPTVKPGLLLMHTIKDFTGQLAMSGDFKFEGIKYGAEYWMGDISLDTHYGFEIGWRNMLFGRIGSDIGNFTAGFGINIKNANVNLAYLHNSNFDETFRISAGYMFK
ncbi:MAG: hypothetical protein ABIJ45_04620 [Candidatus Zixiibacteriota bacterium]